MPETAQYAHTLVRRERALQDHELADEPVEQRQPHRGQEDDRA